MQEAENGKKEERIDVEPEKKDSEEEKSAQDKEIAELKERMLRLAAEFDNYKKRVAKELNVSSEKGKAEMVAKLLPVIDEFELAISTMDLKQEHAKGISLIYSNFISTLRSAGLRPIEASGRYDPYKQEIVLAEESNEEEGTILEVVRKGYALNDIMLRPASVIISKKHAEQTKEEKEGKDDKEDKTDTKR